MSGFAATIKGVYFNFYFFKNKNINNKCWPVLKFGHNTYIHTYIHTYRLSNNPPSLPPNNSHKHIPVHPHTYDDGSSSSSSSFCTHDDLLNNPKTWTNNLKIWMTFSKHPYHHHHHHNNNNNKIMHKQPTQKHLTNLFDGIAIMPSIMLVCFYGK